MTTKDLILDALGKYWTGLKDALKTLTFSNLNTNNKTLPGAINELNGRLPYREYLASSIPYSTSKKYTLSNVHAVLWITAANSSAFGACYIVSSVGTGAVYTKEIASSSSVVVTTGTNEITIAFNGVAGSIAARWHVFTGSVSETA